MYERNAIIIERYFNNMFGYNLKNNIKNNYENYCKLVDALEVYKNSIEEEEEIIIEYDIIANKIRDIQKRQEDLSKQNLSYQEERNNFFQNIDDDANLIQKNIERVNNNINKIDDEIQENAINFINVVTEFNEKSVVRNQCGKKRRTVEMDYNKKLNDTLDNYKNIDIDLEKRAKQFVELDTNEIENELKNEIQKNGQKEKIPFQKDVIEQAIVLSIDNQKRETEILANIYEKTNKLFAEIKNNNLKIEKHKKFIIDSNSKMEFISAFKEYVIQFLDNERLAVVNGENEYNKLMKEACKNLKNDLTQINNLYTLLLKEIAKKATKKTYIDLYNIEYLKDLENNAEEFENEVKKLKLPVAVINPNYWRIEGMKKIYDVFNKCVTDNYNRDLKEFNSSDDDSDEDEKEKVISTENVEEKVNNIIIDEKELNKDVNEEIKKDNQNNDNIDNSYDDKMKSEIDKKIDIILGLKESEKKSKEELNDKKSKKNNEFENNKIENEELWDDEEIDDDELSKEYEEDDVDINTETEEDDEWDEVEDDDNEELDEEIEEDDEWDEETEDDEWDEEGDDDNEELDEETEINDDEWDEEIEEDDEWDEEQNNDTMYRKEPVNVEDEEVDYDIWGNNITKKPNKVKKQNIEKRNDKDWGNEFINIEKKDKNKKKGFFEKFKK